MAWLTLTVWVLLLLIALPLAHGVLLGRISLGLQAIAAGAGHVLMTSYVSVDYPAALAWVASGVALIGVLAVSAAAVNLTSDRDHTVSATSPGT
jgi:hypothetical protein